MMKKRIVGAAIALVVIVSLMAPSLVYAGNISDTSFNFYFDQSVGQAETARRAKLDDTSVYIKLQGISANGFNAKVMGYQTDNSSTAYDCSNGGAWTYYHYYNNQTVYMYNCVYEYRWTGPTLYYAAIRAWDYSGYNYFQYNQAYGLWSPDSV
jgi:hypothetical protein